MSELVAELHIVDDDRNIFDTDMEYIIPLYQRAYAWEDKQLIQLIEDINDVADDANYYIGALIVSRQGNKFEVVDDELLIHKSLLGKSDSFKFEGDYYHSGDLIEWVDKESGLFRFKSRKNELINVGGYKVNPGEVENILLSIEGVKQVLVYGKANSILGNVLCADIQLEDGVALTDVEIKKALRSQLQDFKIPRRIKFVEQMSLTRTGKLKRS